ncbi:MAG TPA: glycoside hydrolase family 3 N-terminal domain-containing protein, partial [Armatimonadota bacterium]|nr:glycoside hydrolase family 3 N-terminal domain-containing protein [Armatimonadota bacterium]
MSRSLHFVLAPLTWIGALVALLCLGAATSSACADVPLYKDAKAPIEQRVEDILKQMTLEEKLDLLGGTGFTTKPIARLGLPAIGMVDGPMGARGGTGGTQGRASVFPCGVAMASTWDPAMIERVGWALGRETQHKGEGADVLLGPCVNIHRSPQGGRNAESFGEDPYLTSRIAVGYIKGLQSTGNAACIKHFACNNQEYQRGSINVIVDERALREIYLPAFKAAVQEAKVWCVMDAYNCLNGPHASADDYLLNTILKKEWGFDGIVMSDWGAVHSTEGAANGGNDLEMPTGIFLNPLRLKPLLDSGQVTQTTIDDKVRRILRIMIRTGLLDGPKLRDNTIMNCEEHQKIALEAAQKAII